jgi:hypothetical protein
LKSTLFSLVDVPDLRALAGLWPETRTIWMGAGPVPEILHRMLIALAWLVRVGLIPSLSPLARLMHAASNRLRWGEHRGGMFVEIAGAAGDGRPARRSWHLLAEADDGPLIPSMAVAALVHRAVEGRLPPAGARAAVRELELDDYERLFVSLTLVLRHWRAFGVPLPLWLCPRSDAYEASVDGRFRFHVAISLPLAGLIVRYEGWLAEDANGRMPRAAPDGSTNQLAGA